MTQLTLRLDNELAQDVKAHAKAAGWSVNAWVVAVLGAAVNPELAEGETERLRARLARAGLLADPAPRRGPRPDPERVARARTAAGAGTPLSQLVSEERG
jgi:hypothetical protein